MKSVLQTIRKSDDTVLDEIDVTNYTQARITRLMREWEETSSGAFYLKYIEDKIEYNGL